MDALVGFAEEGRSRCAIRAGEVPTTCDPAISEWGNPSFYRIVCCKFIAARGAPGELKHLMYPEEKKSTLRLHSVQARDSVSKRRAKAEQSKPRFIGGLQGRKYRSFEDRRTTWNSRP